MTWERRAEPPLEHTCRTPRWRWLPFLIWPRWLIGARWKCGHREPQNTSGGYKSLGWVGGCGAVWEWRLPSVLECGRGASNPVGWVMVQRPPSKTLTPPAGPSGVSPGPDGRR